MDYESISDLIRLGSYGRMVRLHATARVTNKLAGMDD